MSETFTPFLKTCPFCGETPDYRLAAESETHNVHIITCIYCGISMTEVGSHQWLIFDKGGVGKTTLALQLASVALDTVARDIVVARWNRRAVVKSEE